MTTQHGVTLVEQLIVATIFLGLTLGVSWTLSETTQRTWDLTNARLDTVFSTEKALNRLRQDLNQASQSSLVCEGERLTLCLAAPCAEGGVAVSYQRDGVNAALIRAQQGNLSETISFGVLAFTPVCQAEGVVRILLTTRQGGVTKAIQDSVWVRIP